MSDPCIRSDGTRRKGCVGPADVNVHPLRCVHEGPILERCMLGDQNRHVRDCAVHEKCTRGRVGPGAKACSECGEYQEPEQITINHGAKGLGDALQGLLAIGALHRDRPHAHVVYRVAPGVIPWVQMWDGGYDSLTAHDFDVGSGFVRAPGQRQLNDGYGKECQTKGALPRWDRYARNVGTTGHVFPRLRNRDQVATAGQQWAGCIALAPFSRWTAREWRVESWLTLVEELESAGYRPVIVDDQAQRADVFKCDKLIGADPVAVTGLLWNAGCVVGNDSGMVHLAGMLGRPAIALCGQTTGQSVFGCYPTVRWLEGKLTCKGCWWQSPCEARCNASCANLQSTLPAEVVRAVDEVCIPALTEYRAVCGVEKLRVIRREVRATNHLTGDVGELGVYRGGVAKLIQHHAPYARLHLFDTFTGIPEADLFEGGHQKGDFADTSLESVKTFLGSAAAYHVGKFPDAAPKSGLRFRFVHIDGDTYQTTRDALDYFDGRMVPGGAIVLDDYGWWRCPGVARALHERYDSGRVERGAECQAIVRF